MLTQVLGTLEEMSKIGGWRRSISIDKVERSWLLLLCSYHGQYGRNEMRVFSETTLPRGYGNSKDQRGGSYVEYGESERFE
jgi:hypothetical protein